MRLTKKRAHEIRSGIGLARAVTQSTRARDIGSVVMLAKLASELPKVGRDAYTETLKNIRKKLGRQ